MSEELISSAVTFLQDPKVADAPLAKRIAFLESKGLSSEQIQVALQRAQDAQGGQVVSSPAASPYMPTRPAASYASYQQQPPPLPQRDWRDWFIMAIVSGGFSWAAYVLAKRYVLPLISPPTPTQLESDKETVTAQFDQLQEMLSILQKDSEETKERSIDQSKKVEAALTSVDGAVNDMKDKTARREADIRRLGLEVDQLREMIPKAISAVQTAQNDALNDLNGELRSLKTLLQNRMKATAPAALNTPSSTAKGTPMTGSTGVAQVAQSQTATTPKATLNDPLAKFTSRGGNGIPEWQKSAPTTQTDTENTTSDAS